MNEKKFIGFLVPEKQLKELQSVQTKLGLQNNSDLFRLALAEGIKSIKKTPLGADSE